MKKNLLAALFLLCCFLAQGQNDKYESIDANFFYGSILEHNKDLAHLITNHPTGIILSYNRKTSSDNEWASRFNYPDWGFSFVQQGNKNETLGNNYGLYGHFNFYFLNRKLMARVGQGVAYNTNPFDLQDNYRNNAYGSHLLSSTFLMFNYNQPNIIDKIGLNAGISFVHYSNANLRAPNTSTNTLAFNLGLNYDLDEEEPQRGPKIKSRYTEPLKFNFALRTGLNESDYIGLGQRPFLVISSFIDKRVTHKSSFQLGADFFLSPFLKDQIEHEAISLPQRDASLDQDWKRVGVFAGHELHFNKIAVVSQLGYYVYYPYDFEGRTYLRIGLKRYIGKRFFAAATLHSHGAKAEAVEFGAGIRL
ncbi:MAG: deacylase [Cytophagaceae bacterium]|nr:deacylase [Cytophagaceae bacterium]|tara:strand:+ start:9702 stop:10790 length:1089 start_codon:yes stop_codon:yes gene_type:complete